MNTYVPQVIEDDPYHALVTFVLKLDKCVACHTLVMAIVTKVYSPFPIRLDQDQRRQMQAAGIQEIGGYTYEPREGPLCVKCTKQGLGRFKCWHCEQERPVSQQHEQFGDPPDFLCTVCYETLPAKTWDEVIKELGEVHRWDYS